MGECSRYLVNSDLVLFLSGHDAPMIAYDGLLWCKGSWEQTMSQVSREGTISLMNDSAVLHGER